MLSCEIFNRTLSKHYSEVLLFLSVDEETEAQRSCVTYPRHTVSKCRAQIETQVFDFKYFSASSYWNRNSTKEALGHEGDN